MTDNAQHPTPLPAGWYRDPDPFQAERRALFAPAWMPFAPAAALEAGGAYVCSNLGGWPLFAWRDTQGTLRAFHNVCRHQKMPMLQAGSGELEELRCPFHGWVYRQDGSLRHAPPPETPDVDDLSTIRLNPMTVAGWKGLLFIAVGQEPPPPVAEAFVGIADLMPDLASGYDYAGTDSVDLICNWKTYLDFAGALETPAGGPRPDLAAEKPGNGSAVIHAVGGGSWLWAWPLLGAHVGKDVVAVSQLVARTMIRSRLDRHVFVRKGGDGAAALDAWKAVGARQKQAAEAAHKALAATKDPTTSAAPPTPGPGPFGLHAKVRAVLGD